MLIKLDSWSWFDLGSFDASGSFEAEKTLISSEATGGIEPFDIEKEQTLEAKQTIDYIDSLQLFISEDHGTLSSEIWAKFQYPQTRN